MSKARYSSFAMGLNLISHSSFGGRLFNVFLSAVPDTPATPKVLRRDEKTITIDLKPARNTKGPISSYRIALTDTSQSRFLGKDRISMKSWRQAINNGYAYYVAAELSPEVS